ncbi:unnamed protein product [Trichobilharzia szidati]|nr:unnamed protein product [Trichobilharzia szidati]
MVFCTTDYAYHDHVDAVQQTNRNDSASQENYRDLQYESLEIKDYQIEEPLDDDDYQYIAKMLNSSESGGITSSSEDSTSDTDSSDDGFTDGDFTVDDFTDGGFTDGGFTDDDF